MRLGPGPRGRYQGLAPLGNEPDIPPPLPEKVRYLVQLAAVVDAVVDLRPPLVDGHRPAQSGRSIKSPTQGAAHHPGGLLDDIRLAEGFGLPPAQLVEGNVHPPQEPPRRVGGGATVAQQDEHGGRPYSRLP